MSTSPNVSNPHPLLRWAPYVAVPLLLALAALSWQRLASFDWAAFGSIFVDIHWGWAALACVLALLTYPVRVLRWQVMIRPLVPHAPFWPLLKATLIGFTSVVILGRAGDLVRPWLIARKQHLPFSSQMAAWFLERVFDMLAVLALFGFGLLQYHADGRPVGPEIAWLMNAGGAAVAILASACLLILFFAGKSGGVVEERLGDALSFLPDRYLSRVTGLVASFTSGMRCCQRGSDVALLFFYTGIEWLIITLGTFTFFQAFPATTGLSPVDAVVYLGVVSFGGIVQIPGVGGGVQIAGMIALSQLFGVRTEEAAGIALANWLIAWVSVLPFGIGLAASEGLRWGNLRQISEDLTTTDEDAVA